MVTPPNYEDELLNVLKAIGAQAANDTPASSDESTAVAETSSTPGADVGAPSPSPPIPLRVTNKTLFIHPDAHPVILDLALLQKYGPEWIWWEPETISIRVGKDFGAISDLNFSKTMAMKTLHLVDSFWHQWEVFNWCTFPLNGLFPDFEVMQVPTVAQCMVAVDTANRVREDVRFSDEVARFIGLVHQYDGILVPQEPVKSIAIIDTKQVPLNLAEIESKWPSVRVAKKAPTEETAEAEQLRRMLKVHEVLQEARIQLRNQLPLVQHIS